MAMGDEGMEGMVSLTYPAGNVNGAQSFVGYIIVKLRSNSTSVSWIRFIEQRKANPTNPTG